MSLYINTTTNEVVSLGELRALFPNSSIPVDADCSSIGYAKVTVTVPPPVSDAFKAVEGSVVNGAQTWDVVPLTPEELADRLLDKKAQVKHKAAEIINAAYPEWKQRNYLARSVELLKIATPTPEQTAELDSLQAIWDAIKAVRVHSDTLEASLDANIETDIAAGWPVL